MSEWISVKERMPEENGRYLVAEDTPYKWIGVATMRLGKFDIPITHWMPLPEAPPKVEWSSDALSISNGGKGTLVKPLENDNG